ncbi:unnamed protein product [Ambrosiozyma monospora]|uniref:Unnamed protein product n=1 Tax=Ambrosiozyma monospora TaxID=43982 RepID=A0A9W7DC78_AMBMO|nr:unnamed protein product [Ambrosiozyma monospora]
MHISNNNAVISYLSKDLLTKGLLSDIQINAFDKRYNLHTLLIQRSPYFKALINWDTSEFEELLLNDKPRVLNVETDDPFITKESFDLMLKRLYGCQDANKEGEMPLSMIATAFFFQLDDIKESILYNYKFDNLTTQLAVSTLKMLDERDYGEFGLKLEDKCLTFLQDNGWQSGNQEWDNLPVSLIPEIVSSDQFFAPTEFDRIVFATRLFQTSDSSESDIKVVVKMFTNQLSFFTLTYNQQLYLLKLKLRSGEPIFDSSMVNDSNMLSAHIQNSTFFDKYSPISTEKGEIPGDTTFHRYSYPIKISGFSFNNRRYSYGKTVIPPFRFSIALNTAAERLTKKKIYYREFSYCGRVWRVSIYNFKKDDSLKIAIQRMPLSYIRPLYQTVGKYEYIVVPPVREELKDCQMPELLLSAESFGVGPSFRDSREKVLMYIKISLRCNNNLETREVNETQLFEFRDNSPIETTMTHVFSPLKHNFFNEPAPEPLKVNVLIGVI